MTIKLSRLQSVRKKEQQRRWEVEDQLKTIQASVQEAVLQDLSKDSSPLIIGERRAEDDDGPLSHLPPCTSYRSKLLIEKNKELRMNALANHDDYATVKRRRHVLALFHPRDRDACMEKELIHLKKRHGIKKKVREY